MKYGNMEVLPCTDSPEMGLQRREELDTELIGDAHFHAGTDFYDEVRGRITRSHF